MILKLQDIVIFILGNISRLQAVFGQFEVLPPDVAAEWLYTFHRTDDDRRIFLPGQSSKRDQIIATMGGKPSELLFMAVFCVILLLLSELTSHTVAANMIGPLAIGIALSAGFNPVPMAVGVALSASLGFMLPASTPPNVIVYANGYVPITKMIKSGMYIDPIGIAIVTIPVALYLVGMVVG